VSRDQGECKLLTNVRLNARAIVTRTRQHGGFLNDLARALFPLSLPSSSIYNCLSPLSTTAFFLYQSPFSRWAIRTPLPFPLIPPSNTLFSGYTPFVDTLHLAPCSPNAPHYHSIPFAHSTLRQELVPELSRNISISVSCASSPMHLFIINHNITMIAACMEFCDEQHS